MPTKTRTTTLPPSTSTSWAGWPLARASQRAGSRAPGLPGRHAEVVDEAGHRLLVADGYAREREVTAGAVMVDVKTPWVDDRRDGEHYRSVILPAYMRKSPKVAEALPVMYLRGLSTGDFAPALAEFFGSSARLSASMVSRLTEAWQAEHDDWATRDLSEADYVYWWADGVHFNVRLATASLAVAPPDTLSVAPNLSRRAHGHPADASVTSDQAHISISSQGARKIG